MGMFRVFQKAEVWYLTTVSAESALEERSDKQKRWKNHLRNHSG